MRNYEIKPKHSTDNLIIISEYKRIKWKKKFTNYEKSDALLPHLSFHIMLVHHSHTIFLEMNSSICTQALRVLSLLYIHAYNIKVYNPEGTRHMHKHMMVQCGIHTTHMCICAPPLPTHTYINFEVKAIQQTQQNTHISISI